ncbi:hypothetical protein RSOLAG22IIIB_00467 [Rhizoctonia solani]|uniref:Zn(2)-C6 fungal-type domain-containing protein n=1 Tax=Rhizoctonia solani TaxID=456999 RepID=A0A0K6FVB2_9AGAM|nr:hypothetical protein RSOLAG22IIIB_00467 [Rhizoctonia solani]
MPASSATPYAKPAQVGRSRSDVSLMRDKNGCITCRVRQKKCSGIEEGRPSCSDCLRLNIQCLGVSHNRPDWLRNPEALRETKYRIKHHLTEHPVPRGRGPAPKRPHLDFYDLINKYSPRIPTADEYVQLDNLQPMSPESPSQTTNYSSGYLSVHGSHYTSPTTPSPSSSYATMPRGIMTHEMFYNQQSPAYIPQSESFEHLVSPTCSQPSAGSPYRLTHAPPESLFLTSPISPYYPYAPDYLSGHISPSARRQ